MGNRPENDAPEGQLSIEDTHEGIPYTVEPGGSVSVAATKDEEVPF